MTAGNPRDPGTRSEAPGSGEPARASAGVAVCLLGSLRNERGPVASGA